MGTKLMLQLLLLVGLGGADSDYLRESFNDSNGRFQNLVMNEKNGKLYVGAVNRLYQLSETLEEEKRVITGPKDDNPNCPPTDDCTCYNNCEDLVRRPTESINKALVIDYDAKRLIACSNLFQGHCEKRRLNDISKGDDPILDKPMVSNDKNSKVVMFIAPGPIDPPGDNVLYVGVTRSSEGLSVYKDLVPALSSRNLNSFELAFSGVGVASKKELEQQQRDVFKVDYVNGFSSGGFSYFLAVQRQSVEVGPQTQYVTRLLRVCQHDEKYYSYTEVPLECTHTGATYNIVRAAYVTKAGSDLAQSLNLSHLPPLTHNDDVLFALFSKSQPQTAEPIADSVLCIYPLKQIRRVFTQTIQDCFDGVGNTGPAHFLTPYPCIDTEFDINDDYCGTFGDINTPIAGTRPVEATAVVRFEETSTTAIAVTVTHDYTVAFIGTDKGELKKVVIESGTSATEYESIHVEDTDPHIKSDLVFDRTRSHLYVMTENKVHRIMTQKCSQYIGCSDCLQAKDPFCGWCVLENKCTQRSECSNAESPRRWLPYSGQKCTSILQVLPEQVQISPSKATQLTLTVENLPSLTTNDYHCAFSGFGVTRSTQAKIVEQTDDTTKIDCETPFPNLLPAIPTGKDHIVMKLSIRMNGKDFVWRNFTFFDCDLHAECTGCTESEFPCTWCVSHHSCTFNREDCLNDVLITGRNVPGQSDRPGPLSCPRIEASFTEILVPSGTSKKVTVKALNLQNFQTDFKCTFNIDGLRVVNAVKPAATDIIECGDVNFYYVGESPHRNVPFQITWGPNGNPLDNPDRIQVKVYKCSSMADNCGGCLTLENKHNCGWCTSGANEFCSIQNQCTNVWLDHSQDCPDPSISDFWPQTGPTQGGTRLTIEGVNLGKTFDDIKDGVKVAGIKCEPDPAEYRPARRIVCETGKSTVAVDGAILISVRNRFSDASNMHFSYVVPEITDFYPKIGPMSGGTRVTIKGEHLNAGTRTLATVVGHPCEIDERSTTNSMVVCVTSPNPMDSAGLVEIKFDQATVSYNRQTFHYKQDPLIKDVYPEKGIRSGGVKNIVEGMNLDTIQEPKMCITLGNQEFISDCSVKSSTEMVCRSPNVSPGLRMRTDTTSVQQDPGDYAQVSYGFIMDHVQELRNLTATTDRVFRIYADPIFEPFDEGVMYFQTKNEYLTINGEKLNVVLTKDDVTVLIGTAYCNVTSIAPEQLNCRPPSPTADGVGSNPSVVVQIGNLTIPIGELRFETTLSILSFPAIIGIAAGGGVLIILIIIIFIAYRQKSQESDRVMKHMQNQMDILEAKVAKECKEAFAELQTDMTELTSDLSGTMGIPFRDYRSFSMRVLFPNMAENEHPVTRSFEVQVDNGNKIGMNEGLDRALRTFNGLLLNKTFLLLFIRTLENQKEFSMREKVNVASLISVALQGRMDYHTDILKTLLADLIEKSVEGRSHPKLFLRRTESVAEKMLTNWFTFLLYKFLRECAGEPLFMLFRAIKQQVDKGPVDALTSEAKYSLSEDKLIRQLIDYKVMTLYVVDPDIAYSNQEHTVKVLDCDTIT